MRAFDILRDAGFDNINLDLIFALPDQTRADWQETLRQAAALQSEHLSCYEITYEEDTPLFRQLDAGAIRQADDDLACALYQDLQDVAAQHGFIQYEVANFARGPLDATAGLPLPHRACRHNVNYWRGGEFYGLGPSASSFVDGRRWKNWPDTRAYCERLEQAQSPIQSFDDLSPLARAGEIAAFGLRMVIGWKFTEFQQITGFDLRQQWQDDLQHLAHQEWGVLDAEGFRLTAQGLRFADAAAERFLR